MAFRRKIHEYRECVRQGLTLPAPIPYSTWRRMLNDGRISEEELLEMGINPAPKRKRRRMECNPDPSSEAPLAVNGSGGSNNHIDGSDSAQVSGALFDWLHNEEPASPASKSDQSGSSDDGERDNTDQDVSSVLESKKIGVEALNEKMSEGSKLSKFEVMLMIFHLVMRHGLTDVLLHDLIDFANLLIGDTNPIPSSTYLFRKLFMFGAQPIIHFFCPDCQKYLGPKSSYENLVTCDDCEWSKTASSMNDQHYFVTLRIEEQLREVLNRPNVQLVSRKNRRENVYSDICDGEIYKLLRESGPLSDENALTISASTDGSPVFKNGPNTLYPIHFHLNEIVPHQRFDVENMLLAGLWFSKIGDPNLQIFFKPVVEELLSLENRGIIWKKPDGCVVQSSVYLTCVCADSVARPKVQNFALFNSSYGCSYCMHPNLSIRVTEPLKKRHGIKAALPVNDLSSDEEPTSVGEAVLTREVQIKRYLSGEEYPVRTDGRFRRYMEMASRTHVDHVYGVKGECVLAPLGTLNLAFGFPIDYLHQTLLGITKRLVNLWFDSKSSGKPYYFGSKLGIVNERIVQLHPPSDMMSPRSLAVRSFWKAREWRAFLLHYGLPCLIDVLTDNYYNHFKKYSTAIFILSKEQIGHDECQEAEQLLKEFVVEYETLYGGKNMVYNTHMACHLGQQVRKLGPLWAYSLFPFETANGRLVKLVKGTNGVATQIAQKFLMTHSVYKLLRGGLYSVQDSVLNFCCKVVEYKYSQSSTKCDDVRLMGRPSVIALDENQKEVLLCGGLNVASPYVKAFNRALMNRMCVSSKKLTRQKVSNDSCVRLQDGSFAVVEYILLLDDEPAAIDEGNISKVWCIGTLINIAIDTSFKMPPHVKECALDSFGAIKAFPFKNIRQKCFLMSVDGYNYVGEFPNTFEKS